MENYTLPFDKNQGYLILDNSERRYFSKIDVDCGYVLLTKTKKFYFVDSRYFVAVKEMLFSTDFIPMLYSDYKDIKRAIKSQKIKSLFIDFSKTTVAEFLIFKKFNVKLCDCKSEIEKIRSIKTNEEIEAIKKACEIIEKALYCTYKKIKIGQTEKEIKDILNKEIISFGGEGESFDSIVAFNSNSAVPHHKTGEEKLKENTVILIDTGAVYKGYKSDITRTVFFGEREKLDSQFVCDYNECLMANEIAIEKIKVGYKTNKADSISREYLIEKGLGQYFTHSLGHGVGLDIHEYPYLSKKRKDLLRENMVFTIEPGIYKEGKYGIRIEDTVLLTQNGVERLYTDDKQLKIINNK